MTWMSTLLAAAALAMPCVGASAAESFPGITLEAATVMVKAGEDQKIADLISHTPNGVALGFAPLQDTFLHVAADLGKVALIKRLVAAGCAVDVRNKFKATPLASALDAQTAELLISLGAKVDARDDVDGTPLIQAAGAGRSGTVSALLAHGADPNLVNSDGWTALHWAANAEVVKALLTAKSINRNPKNGDGKTPLALALENHNAEVIAIMKANGFTQ